MQQITASHKMMDYYEKDANYLVFKTIKCNIGIL